MLDIKVNYPKLPTRILTLEVLYQGKVYYFGISEYDYQAHFLKKHEEQLERIIVKNQNISDFASFEKPYIIYFVDGSIA